MEGKIKSFDEEDKLGFIESEDSEEEILFVKEDFEDIDREIEEGLKVEFEIKEDKKGPEAKNLELS